MSNDTLQWIANRDLTDEERIDPDTLIAAFEAYIKESTNPLVTVVELFTMKRHAHESADKLHARINEKLNKVDFSVIKDIRDYFGMTATIIANEPTLRKQMYLDKVDTYAKAHAAVKADEQATSHSKMVGAATSSSSTSATLNAVSSYKRNQNQSHQNNASAGAQRGGYSGNNSQGPSSSGRGGNRGGYQGNNHRGRGGNASGESRPTSPDRSQSRDRGRSDNRNSSRDQGRSQSVSSQAAFGKCEACNRTGHARQDCWTKDRECFNCGQRGHISPMCTQPQQSQSASGGSTFFLEGSLGSVTATFDAPRGSPTPSEVWLGSVSADPITDVLQVPAAKWDREVPAISLVNNVNNPDDVVTVVDKSSNSMLVSLKAMGGEPFDIFVDVDVISSLTAIPASMARNVPLFDTDKVLHTADNSTWPAIGTFYAQLKFRDLVKVEQVCVIEGLPQPLLAADLLQDLGFPPPVVAWSPPSAPVRDTPARLSSYVQTPQAPTSSRAR